MQIILDVITAALIVIPMGIGMSKGLVYVAVRTLGWIGALAASFFAAPGIAHWLSIGPVGEFVYGVLQEKFNAPLASVDTATQGLPSIISGSITSAAEMTAASLVQTIGGLILSVGSFLALTILIRLALAILLRLTRRKGEKDRRRSFLSRMDQLGGLAVGGIEGLLLAFLFLAALIPCLHMCSPELSEAIGDGLNYSYLAGPLYDGNFIMVLISPVK